jgi:hypothetical protein
VSPLPTSCGALRDEVAKLIEIDLRAAVSASPSLMPPIVSHTASLASRIVRELSAAASLTAS